MLSINEQAPVKCSKSILIHAKLETVWKVLTDINNWPSWQKDISVAKVSEPLAPESNFSWKSAGVKIHSTIHSIRKNENLGWTGKGLQVTAIHNWKLEGEDDAVKVNVSESMEGILARLFHSSFNATLANGMQRWLQFLKAECEAQDLITLQ